MYNPNEIVKFNVSRALKNLNKQFHRNYTLQDVAERICVSRESLSRLSSKSSFSTIYAIASCLYELYPDYSECWNFSEFVMLLSDDNAFLL